PCGSIKKRSPTRYGLCFSTMWQNRCWFRTYRRRSGKKRSPRCCVTIQIFNGPNLNRLGTREPGIYGTTTYQDLVSLCRETASRLALTVQVRQTNAEHELLDWLHAAA